MADVIELRRLEFDARQRARELRLAVFEARNLDAMPQLVEGERELQRISEERAAEEKQQGIDDGSIVSFRPESNLLGPQTTGLDVKVELRMSSVATSIVHLLGSNDQPLVSYEILNTSGSTKRLRLISYVEGFSASAVDTIEVVDRQPTRCVQLPTFFADRIGMLHEVNRATVNVEVQDLDARTEVHKTIPVWLLARSTAPLQVKDPSTGKWKDLTPYLGAFVTPNAPEVMSYLRKAVEKQPNKRLVGYQVSPEKVRAGEEVDKEEVASEVKAVFDALAESQVVYINSVIDFTPEAGTANNQRVRVPREALADRSANCIDGTVLVASLLEGISLNPAIVIVPGHAFVGWETWRNNGEWRYLETTIIASHSFEEACMQGDLTAQKWQALDQGAKTMFKRWSLRDLRAMGITPLE
jgi:hypothetical protein